MDLTFLQSVVNAPGPFTSVHLDVSRDDAASARELPLRWDAVRRQLAQEGAPSGTVEAIGARVLEQTGRPGDQGRSIVANSSGVLLDRLYGTRPLRDSGHHGLLPHFMPLVRGLDRGVAYVVVAADRSGATISVVDDPERPAEQHDVEGGHDVLHQVPGGGWAQRRYLSRVLDSWERNADAVAKDLDDVVVRHRPELVLLTGDPNACAALRKHVGRRAAALIEHVDGGGRADGIDPQAWETHLDDSLSRHRQTRMGNVLARYEQAAGQDNRAAAGLDAVVDALRASAVETLLLRDDPSSTLTLWAGPQPLHLGTTSQDVEALGAEQVVEDRADAVLLRALVGQGGSVELVGGADVLRDGVGALLRYDTRPPVPGGRQ